MFTGSKYPKQSLYAFENKITAVADIKEPLCLFRCFLFSNYN